MSWGKERVMTAPVRVSERGLHTLLGIVADDRDELPAARLPDSLLSDLMNLVRCDLVAFSGLDSSQQTHWFGQDVPAKDISDGCRDSGHTTGTAPSPPSRTVPETCAA